MKNLYMPQINWLKVGVIWLTDAINKIYDPFKVAPDYLAVNSLEELEKLFYADLEARFVKPDGEFLYELPRPRDAGDTALFQGLMTGMKILKGEDVSKQFDFIQSLFIEGSLIRGWDDNGISNDTTSNDSASGMLFFFYVAFRWGSQEIKEKAGDLLIRWITNIKIHGWALVDIQGKPTTYGQLEDGFKTDPLRLTLLLALLALVSKYDSSFQQDYDDLYRLYKPILTYPKVKLLWLDTSYDTHRAAINLHVLYWLTNDKIYKKGLQRIWRITKKELNAWVYTLCSPALDKPDSQFVFNILSTFDFNKRLLGNIESINDVPSVNWPPKIFNLTKPKVRSKVALPIHVRGSQDFFWQRNMFSKDEWIGNTTAGTYHSGLDFLICGWLADRLGLIDFLDLHRE